MVNYIIVKYVYSVFSFICVSVFFTIYKDSNESEITIGSKDAIKQLTINMVG